MVRISGSRGRGGPGKSMRTHHFVPALVAVKFYDVLSWYEHSQQEEMKRDGIRLMWQIRIWKKDNIHAFP